MTVKIEIQDLPDTETLTVVRDPERASIKQHKQVQWWSDQFKDWRVIFGPDAPLHPKVASRAHPELNLTAKRAEDLKHVKYVVVALTKDGRMKHVDPELIVDE